MGRARGLLPLVGWVCSLGLGIVLFTSMGDGPLAAPALTDPGSWGGWADGRDPMLASVAILRLVVLGLAWYLVGVTTIGLLARLTRAAALIRVADALTVPFVRRLLQGALGVGLATAMVGAAAGAPGRAFDGPGPGGGQQVAAASTVDGDGGATMERVEPEVASMDRVEDPSTARMTLVDSPNPAMPERSSRHEVAAGEHLWVIAEEHLTEAFDRQPDDDEVHTHWKALIEHNRDRLADPDNPDLIYPGQVIELPEPEQRA